MALIRIPYREKKRILKRVSHLFLTRNEIDTNLYDSEFERDMGRSIGK